MGKRIFCLWCGDCKVKYERSDYDAKNGVGLPCPECGGNLLHYSTRENSDCVAGAAGVDGCEGQQGGEPNLEYFGQTLGS